MSYFPTLTSGKPRRPGLNLEFVDSSMFFPRPYGEGTVGQVLIHVCPTLVLLL